MSTIPTVVTTKYCNKSVNILMGNLREIVCHKQHEPQGHFDAAIFFFAGQCLFSSTFFLVYVFSFFPFFWRFVFVSVFSIGHYFLSLFFPFWCLGRHFFSLTFCLSQCFFHSTLCPIRRFFFRSFALRCFFLSAFFTSTFCRWISWRIAWAQLDHDGISLIVL